MVSILTLYNLRDYQDIGVGVYDILNEDFDESKFKPGPSVDPLISMRMMHPDAHISDGSPDSSSSSDENESEMESITTTTTGQVNQN